MARPLTRRQLLSAVVTTPMLTAWPDLGWAAQAPPPDDTIFTAAGVEGAFVLTDLRSRRDTVINPRLADMGHLPASTFKVPNTLIGLETGVISDEHFTLRWDGSKQFLPAWERDQDLESAIRASVVWFYQEVARRVGAERMQAWVTKLRYGNADISGGIDQFWLSGDLRVSPRQQAGFMSRLVEGTLPVQPRSTAILRRILQRAESGGTWVRWKTGAATQGTLNLGWVVGFVETNGAATHTFATLVRTTLAADPDKTVSNRERKTTTLALLKQMKIVPEGMPEPA